VFVRGFRRFAGLAPFGIEPGAGVLGQAFDAPDPPQRAAAKRVYWFVC